MSDDTSVCVHSQHVRGLAIYVDMNQLFHLREKYGRDLPDELRRMAKIGENFGYLLRGDEGSILEAFLSDCEDCRFAFARGILDQIREQADEEESVQPSLL